jgi:tetratricopeptide (TPR) repeat protein
MFIGMGLAVAAWTALQAVADWQVRSGLRAAEHDLHAGHVGDAQARLASLARRWPGRGDVEYLLGTCEYLGGHEDVALRAWGRVPDRAGEAPRANLLRGRLALETGRYGLAERCFERARLAGGDIGAEARQLMSPLWWVTGRRDEVRSMLQKDVERMRDPSEPLRMLWRLDHDPYPLNRISQLLDKAKRTAPDDDRVWLALADLATQVGHFEEADDWLTRCERARPDDSAVWRARLRWARAAGRPDEVARAARHLPRSNWTQASLLELRAWMAARTGDRLAERAALESFITLEPGDAAAIERLADLAALAGEKERFAELSRRKAEIQVARDRYEQRIIRPEIAPHAPTLARAAESIGRRFDAKAWWRIAAERDPSIKQEATAAQIRLAKAEATPLEGSGTLADLLDPVRSPGTDKEAVHFELSAATFAEDADRRGVVFTLDNGRSDLRQLPETMSGGVALLDFDGDGWLDIYAVQGGKFPPPAGPAPFGDRLWHNRGDGRFEDVTVSSGLTKLPGGYGHGVAVGDYDNDGRPDLFITRWRSYALYHNLGQGKFEDVTIHAGLGGDRDWPTSAAWADLDNDRDLDLYVCHYLKWDTVNPTLCNYPGAPDHVHTYCDPRRFDALPDHVFRNDGGRFVDVTEKTGLIDREGRGLGVVAADLDDDGKIDLFVANDMSANYFLRNRGAWRFSEEGLESGLATGAAGGYLSGMGVACGDFDGDGRLDLSVTNFLNQGTTLYHNHGGGTFSDRSAVIGLAGSTRLVLGFGLAALDANNDGKLDLVQANGDVEDYRSGLPSEMRSQLFLGDGIGKLIDVSERAGPPWQVPRIARGLAVGDLDNDGRTDVVIISQNTPLALLHNQSASQNHSLTLLLEGTASNRDAVGARATVTAAGRAQVVARFGGGSYQSASDQRLHFGLGPARVVDRIEVTWPSGRRNRYEGLVLCHS